MVPIYKTQFRIIFVALRVLYIGSTEYPNLQTSKFVKLQMLGKAFFPSPQLEAGAMFSFVYVLLLTTWVGTYAIDLLKEARSGAGTMVSKGRHDYFVFKNKRHLFPDRFTTIAYGFLIVPETHVSFDSLQEGEAITSMWVPNVPNQRMLDRLQGAQNKQLILETVAILHNFTSVAVLYRPTQRDWLIQFATKRMSANFRVVYIPASRANSTSLGAGLTEATQWIAQNIDDWSGSKPSVPFIDVFGSDCKLLGLDDNKQVMLTFTRPHHPGAQSVTYFGELFVRHKTSEITSEVSLVIEDVIDVILHLPKHPLVNEHAQINWVPFEYNKDLLFVPYLWPLTVVDMYIDKRSSVWHAHAPFLYNQTTFKPDTTVAKSVRVLTGTSGDSIDCSVTSKCPWQHGRPRGSTPALLLPNGQYLGIFHSYDQLSRDQLTSTYMFGAYTFKAEAKTRQGKNDITFTMTAMSAQPITSPQMYTGPWYTNPDLFGFIDYIVNPVSVLLEGEYVYILYSHQLTSNFMAKLKLADLLASLERVVE